MARLYDARRWWPSCICVLVSTASISATDTAIPSRSKASEGDAPHVWIAAPPNREAKAFFTNLKDGAIVSSPFLVRFGMSGWGIAPAGKDLKLSGHHHLLIDTPLPMLHRSPIPFAANYLHFGKGQMEGMVSLPPGPHTLRLLLADHRHVPHLVFSDTLNIVVSDRVVSDAEKPKQEAKPALFFVNVRDGEVLHPYFKLQFHASGLNVSNKLSKEPGTLYFQVKVTTEKGKIETINIPSGQTEIWMKIPRGHYKFQLRGVMNPGDEIYPVMGDEINVKIA